jgi:hypothetical protein
MKEANREGRRKIRKKSHTRNEKINETMQKEKDID